MGYQNQQGDGEFEKELSDLRKEIGLEKQRLEHIKEEENLEETQINQLDNELDELKKEHDEHRHKAIKLVFIVNTNPVEIDAELDWTLKKAVELALEKSGNGSRPISDWTVKQGDTTLDIDKPIGDFHFRECEEIYVSLKAGHGGDIDRKQKIVCRL